MLFNILTLNHGDADAISRLAPIIGYIRHTLSRCGHEVIVEHSALHKRAVNVFLEHFLDRDGIETLIAMKASQGFVVGVIATELIVGGTIPYAEHGLTYEGDKRSVVRGRIDNFNRLAPHLDFVWSFLPRTTNEYRGCCPIVETFPVGHVYAMPNELRRSPRDIDVFFFGAATPHRVRVLELLKERGISPVTVGRSFPKGWAASSELDSLLDRAKIGLNLTLHAYTHRDPVDPRFASCHRVPEMLEHQVCIVSESIPLDNHYADYMVSVPPEEIAETCQRLLASGDWRSTAAKATQAFRRDLDVLRVCKPVIDKTAAAITAAYSWIT